MCIGMIYSDSRESWTTDNDLYIYIYIYIYTHSNLLIFRRKKKHRLYHSVMSRNVTVIYLFVY